MEYLKFFFNYLVIQNVRGVSNRKLSQCRQLNIGPSSYNVSW